MSHKDDPSNRSDFHDAALRPAYTYRRNPLFSQSFQIFRKRNARDMAPYATYMILDSQEDQDLSERKVMNLVSILNGRNRLLDLGHGTGSRTLHYIPERSDPRDGQRVVFYTLYPDGPSRENAILVFEPDALLLHQEEVVSHG